MRILHVTPFYPPAIGGISNMVFNICRELERLSHNIHIVTSRKIMDREYYEQRKSVRATEIRSIHLPGWPYSTLRNFSFPADMGFKIDTLIKEGGYDVVHVHGHHYPLCWIALNSAHRRKIPTILSLHGTYALNPAKLGGKSTIEDLFNKYIFKRILLKSNFVIGLTNQNIEYAKKFSSPYNKFRIIPNGVDSIKYRTNLHRKKEYRKKLNISDTKLVILFVGRFDESKGALNFVKAAELLLHNNDTKFEIVMVGHGNLKNEINRVAGRIKDIHILDWQPSDKIHEIYLAADIFVLPSKFEGLPLTILEAMAANLHIIYSNVGGVDEILQNYPNKYMLQNLTPEEISQVCLKSYHNYPDLLNGSSKGCSFIYDWKNIAGMINDVYNEI